MAEAIPDDSSQLSAMTECPVCLETLRKPKYLPCLHTFCLECLETYIAKVTSPAVVDDTHASPPSLPCPVCRALVLPPTTPVDNKTWASHFPTNTFVLAILEKRRKLNEDICRCEPCKRQDKYSDGTLFCTQCSFFMCTQCKTSFHDVLFGDHRVACSAEEHRKTKRAISNEILCERHGDKMEYVCLDHAVIECYKCVIADHRQCLKVVPVLEHIAEIRAGNQVTETLSDLARGSQDMTSLEETFQRHADVMKDNEAAVKQELEDMLKLFQDIKQKAETNLSKKMKENMTRSQDKVDEFKSLRKSMTNTNTAIKTVLSEGNEVHLVAHMLRAKAEIRTCRQLSNHILTSWFTERLSLNITPSLKSLQCVTQSPTRDITSSKDSLPMPVLNLCRPLYGRSAKLTSTFQISTGNSRVTGSLFLDNGHLLIVDYARKILVLFNENCVFIDKMTVDSIPLACCLLDEGIAVTLVEPNTGICIIQIKDEKITRLRLINLPVAPYGIAVAGGGMVITCPDNRPCDLRSVIDDDRTKRLLKVDGRPGRMTSRGNNVFISDMNCKLGGNGVHCISVDTCVIRKVKSDTLAGPRGLDFDREGNLYVCGRESGNVVQISKDMQHCRDILTDVGEVESIALNGNRFFLSLNKSSKGFIYALV